MHPCDARSFLTHHSLTYLVEAENSIRPFHQMPSPGNRPTRLRPSITPPCMEWSAGSAPTALIGFRPRRSPLSQGPFPAVLSSHLHRTRLSLIAVRQ
jgi:hypothetical protein